MKLNRSFISGALLACTLSAGATEITMTSSGHVLDFPEPGVLVDHTRVLGAPGASLAGGACTAVIRCDDTLGTLTAYAGHDLLSTPGQASGACGSQT